MSLAHRPGAIPSRPGGKRHASSWSFPFLEGKVFHYDRHNHRIVRGKTLILFQKPPMLRFRVHSAQAASSFDLLAVSHVIDDAMQPGHFFVAPDLPLTWTAARSESIAWEIFRGRLLDATQTRQVQTFLSWHVEQHGEPLISVKLDIYSGQVHVTRGLQCHVWEGYDAGGGVIDSREAVKWTRELVGTIRLDRCADLEELRDELICLLWQAVVGTSRLPLTSVEAPLPAFVFGQLHYLYQPDAKEQATSSWEDWLTRGFQTPIAWRETVKLIEFVLRRVTSAELPRLTEFATGAIHELPRLLRALFNDVGSFGPVHLEQAPGPIRERHQVVRGG